MRLFFLFIALSGAARLWADPAPNWILPDANDRSLTFYDDAHNRAAVLLFPGAHCRASCEQALGLWVEAANAQHAKVYWLSSSRQPAAAPAPATQLYNARVVARQYGALQEARVVLVNAAREKVWSGPAQSEPDAVLAVWQSQWLAGTSQ
ncbi:hypothetical protein [Simiduia agarivorans]|uniref:Thioredoxin domain-containing protein n=1 Tax=Simiduia agarivorans (strain DSM 21679 / JCM 13881 / BCRC 17597 / SA1) TaxID=1117647 RepID=K4KZN0_SIMAS|nr:hypothetical protein [Simiduia agarivorans]AFU99392.1 hypothetical protein M5M_11075 [Simiduia agarivorans SA1 = DSM 21679]